MKKPKILILIMSCNKDFFKKEVEVLKETYIKRISKYDNINYFIYTSSNNIETYLENDTIYVNAFDDFNGTWEKTYKCLKFIDTDNYDYIIKTNTSTFINIDLLVNLLQYMYNIKNNQILSSDFVKTPKFGFGCSGNATILRKSDINNIINNYISLEDFKKENNIDDNTYIGDDIILNSIIFNKLTDNDITEKFGLIKGVYYKDETKRNHIYSLFEDNLEILRSCIFITFRKHNKDNYSDREEYNYRLNEIEECKKLNELFNKYEYSPYDVINCLKDYWSNKIILYFDLENFKYKILKYGNK